MNSKETQSQEKATSQPQERIPQPEPFTPGITKGMVRQHAYKMFRDKLTHESLTLQDWVMAEKDLVHSLQTDNVPR